MKTWVDGDVLYATDINGNFTEVNAFSVGLVPVGSIIPWLKSYTNTPALGSGFVECNGQVLSDAESVFNGQTIPNLNGTTEATKRFLRGSTTSGGTGGADSYSHGHSTTNTTTPLGGVTCAVSVNSASVSAIPPYYEVVFIMRIK